MILDVNDYLAKYTNAYIVNSIVSNIYLELYNASTTNWWNYDWWQAYCSNNCRNVCNSAYYCRYEKKKKIADAYYKGVEWFGNANDYWKRIIGGLEWVPVQQNCKVTTTTNKYNCSGLQYNEPCYWKNH